jgi:hypothetical protein
MNQNEVNIIMRFRMACSHIQKYAVSKAIDIRKNGERPFNLLKKREGLEQVRVRSYPSRNRNTARWDCIVCVGQCLSALCA